MALRGIDELAAVGVARLELEHRRGLLADGAPAGGVEVTRGAVDHHELGVGVRSPVVGVGPPVVGREFLRALEMALHEHVAVGGLDVAHPGERTAVVEELAVVGEEAAAAEDRVAVADQLAVLHVDGAVGLQGVAGADDPHAVHRDPLAVQEQTLGLAVEVGGDADVLEDDVIAVVQRERGAAGREGARPLVGLDQQRVRVEDLVVGVVDLGGVHAGALDHDVGLVAGVDDLLVVARGDGDPGGVLAEVGHGVERALDRVEVAAAVGGHAQVARVGGAFRLGGELPGAFLHALEFAAHEHAGIDGYIVGVAVLEQVVVGIDRGHVVMDDHRVEAESVRESADDRQLHVARRGLGPAGRRARDGVLVGGDEVAAVVVGRLDVVALGSVGAALGQAGGQAHVEAVHAFAAAGVEDADEAALSQRRRFGEGEHEVGVGIDPGGLLGREVSNRVLGAGGRQGEEGGQQELEFHNGMGIWFTSDTWMHPRRAPASRGSRTRRCPRAGRRSG